VRHSTRPANPPTPRAAWTVASSCTGGLARARLYDHANFPRSITSTPSPSRWSKRVSIDIHPAPLTRLPGSQLPRKTTAIGPWRRARSNAARRPSRTTRDITAWPGSSDASAASR
jgi:hypothetical protein